MASAGRVVVQAAWRLLESLEPAIQTVALLVAAALSWTVVDVAVLESDSAGVAARTTATSSRMSLQFTRVVAAVVATAAHRVGCCQRRPLLRLPWLLLTAEGLLLCQGPDVLRQAQRLLFADWDRGGRGGPGILGPALLLALLAVFCEQTALWLQEARSFLRERPEWPLLAGLIKKRAPVY